MTITRRLSALLLFFLCVLGNQCALAQDTDSDFLILDNVEYLISHSNTPPADSQTWQKLPLPLGTLLADEDESNRIIWMRFELNQPSNNELHSLYFYRYNLSLEVFFNGEKIGGDSYQKNRQTVAWNRPKLIDIQNSNWLPENNIVHVRFITSYYGGTFAPIIFGNHNDLEPLYQDRLFRQIRVNEWLQVTGIIVTLLAFTLWLARRKDMIYLFFAGMTASWTLLTTHMVIYHNPIDYQYWLSLIHLSIDIWVLLLFSFLTRLTNISSPRAEKAIRYWAAVAIVWNLLGSLEYWWVGVYAIHLIGNFFIAYILARIVTQALRHRDKLAIAISLTVLLQLGFFAHDLLMIFLTNSDNWQSANYYSHLAFPLMLAVFIASLLNRFTSALTLAESLNKDLEAKVEKSRQIIEKSYAEKRQLELTQAAEKERLSIYRDLHDDVGSKLLSIVHADRDSKLGELAKAALESLRHAVSRANSPKQKLSIFLSQLSEEAGLRLEGSGHQLDWAQPEHLPDITLPSETVFNLNQVFRELVSNIIRHADANTVKIELCTLDNQWFFEVQDNGRGMSSETKIGNGLNHIDHRMKELGGHTEWIYNTGSGVKVRLHLASF